MDIALTSDAAYLEHAAVLVRSIINEHPGTELDIWLLTPTTTWTSQDADIWSSFANVNVRIHTLATDTLAVGLPRSSRADVSYLSTAMYLRLFLPQILANHGVNRFAYLDSDMICVGPITALAELSLGTKIIGAAQDAYTPTVSDQGGVPNLDHYADIQPHCSYFNSGLLVIDVDRWLQADVTEHCMQYIERATGQLRFPDQDALNVVLHDQWVEVPDRFNYQKPLEMPPRDLMSTPRKLSLLHPIGQTKWWHTTFPESEAKSLYWRLHAGNTRAH